MRKLLWAAVLLLLLSNMYAAPALALSCAEIPAVEEAYEKYDGVIVGEVDDVDRKNDEHLEVKVTVQQSFKGVEVDQVTLLEDPTWGNLNGPSEAGEKYLYFLRLTDDDQWENPLCSPSMKVGEADEELAYLEDKEIPITLEPVPTGSPSEDERFEEPAASDDVPGSGAQEEDKSALTNEIILAIILVILIGVIIYTLVRKRS